MKYFCYYNLHKHIFSLKNRKTGLVEKDKYSNTVKMINCEFKVSEAGRQRVLKEQRKNVHAGVVGELCGIEYSLEDIESDFIELTYNPYKYSSFVIKTTEEPVNSADEVFLMNRKVYAKGIK